MDADTRQIAVTFSAIMIGAIAITVIVGAIASRLTERYNAKIDAICATRAMVGKDYRRMVGKTILGARLCVDDNGQVFDPSEWATK